MPRKSKAEPWEGDSSDDNNWEPEENPDNNDLMSTFDEIRTKKETETAPPKGPTDAVDESNTSRKRGRRDKKKKTLEEIEKPRGVDRGLRPERILAAQLHNSNVYFLVKWHDCLEVDVVPGKDLNQHYPEFVIQYYESCVPFSVRHKIGRIPRIAPELPPEPEPEEPQVPMDVSENLEPPPMPSTEPMDEQPAEQTSMPDMSLPDLPMPEEATQPEPQSLEVPVN